MYMYRANINYVASFAIFLFQKFYKQLSHHNYLDANQGAAMSKKTRNETRMQCSRRNKCLLLFKCENCMFMQISEKKV